MNAAELPETGLLTLDAAQKWRESLRAAGKKMVYLTNNSSRGESDYREKLKRMNLWRDGDSVYTSGMATANLLKTDYAGKRVNLLGTKALKSEFVANGIELVDEKLAVFVERARGDARAERNARDAVRIVRLGDQKVYVL